MSSSVSEEEEVKEKEECKRGSWSHLFVYQKNSETKSQEVVVCLYSLRRVEINYGVLVDIYRILYRRVINWFLQEIG